MYAVKWIENTDFIFGYFHAFCLQYFILEFFLINYEIQWLFQLDAESYRTQKRIQLRYKWVRNIWNWLKP